MKPFDRQPANREHEGPRRALARRRAAFVLAAVAIGAAILRAFPPGRCPCVPPCWLHRLTHLSCAGCGGTRALGLLARGRLFEAVRMNALVSFAACYLVAACAVCLATGAWRLAPRLSARSAVALVALVLLFAVLRNLPWVPFVYLNPPG